MDILTDLLNRVRLNGTLLFHYELGGAQRPLKVTRLSSDLAQTGSPTDVNHSFVRAATSSDVVRMACE
jgi:hypothetical protein